MLFYCFSQEQLFRFKIVPIQINHELIIRSNYQIHSIDQFNFSSITMSYPTAGHCWTGVPALLCFRASVFVKYDAGSTIGAAAPSFLILQGTEYLVLLLSALPPVGSISTEVGLGLPALFGVFKTYTFLVRVYI